MDQKNLDIYGSAGPVAASAPGAGEVRGRSGSEHLAGDDPRRRSAFGLATAEPHGATRWRFMV